MHERLVEQLLDVQRFIYVLHELLWRVCACGRSTTLATILPRWRSTWWMGSKNDCWCASSFMFHVAFRYLQLVLTQTERKACQQNPAGFSVSMIHTSWIHNSFDSHCLFGQDARSCSFCRMSYAVCRRALLTVLWLIPVLWLDRLSQFVGEHVARDLFAFLVSYLQVHRKGSTRAFPPHHPAIPVDYQFIGQPVLIGGTMGTCRWLHFIFCTILVHVHVHVWNVYFMEIHVRNFRHKEKVQQFIQYGPDHFGFANKPIISMVGINIFSLDTMHVHVWCGVFLSYVLTGTEKGMQETFGSTCHGAGRARRFDFILYMLLQHSVKISGGSAMCWGAYSCL